MAQIIDFAMKVGAIGAQFLLSNPEISCAVMASLLIALAVYASIKAFN